MLKKNSIAIAMLIASSAGAVELTKASSTLAPSSNSTTEHAMTTLTASPRELLVSIKSSLAKGDLLNSQFYQVASLQSFFGFHYRFTEPVDRAGRTTIYFDDGGNNYIDEQEHPAALGTNRPCLHSGTIVFRPGDANRKTSATISVLTTAPSDATKSFSASLVQEIFGTPTKIIDGRPSAPAPHGYAYIETPRSNELGNRWLIYDADQNGHLQRIRFRTLSDATVTEVQLFEEQR